MESQPEWTNIHSIHAQHEFSWGKIRHRQNTLFLGEAGKHVFLGQNPFSEIQLLKSRVLGQVHPLQGHFFFTQNRVIKGRRLLKFNRIINRVTRIINRKKYKEKSGALKPPAVP